VPVLAVGPHSLQAAKDAGFSNVTAKGGDVAGLCSYIEKNLDPQAGPLLYISGSETSGDLEGKLSAQGFSVERVVSYDAVAARLDEHDAKIRDADAVMLYSPRTAKIWRDEIVRLQLDEFAASLEHICLSTNVAAALPQSWAKTIAKIPTESAILAALDYVIKAE
jgi:uroporphyrinogen-III synthase